MFSNLAFAFAQIQGHFKTMPVRAKFKLSLVLSTLSLSLSLFACSVPTENAPRADKLSASVSKGKKSKESNRSKGQSGSRPSSQVILVVIIVRRYAVRLVNAT